MRTERRLPDIAWRWTAGSREMESRTQTSSDAWYSEKENSHKHLIFKDAFFERADLIGLLFRINKLCMAKVNYFRRNIEKYEPLKYDYRKGFLTVPLWDADFLKHKDSGLILDFRYLQSITIYDDFVSLCKELENFETE